MTVEYAILMPVCLVIIFTVFNLMLFINLCAEFDHIAKDAVLICAAQTSNSDSLSILNLKTKEYIESSMRSPKVKTEVTSHKIDVFTLEQKDMGCLGDLVKVECEMRFYPVVHGFSAGYIDFLPPVYLRHETSLVVAIS